MEKENNLKNRLQVGDKIFYHDGYTSFEIEEVVQVIKPDKVAILSNNAYISRYPNPDGTFTKVNNTGANLPDREGIFIKKATPELIKLRDAIIAKKRIIHYIFTIEQDLLKRTEAKSWDRWSLALQDELIHVCGHLAKAVVDEPLTEDEEELVKKVIREDPEPKPEEVKNPEVLKMRLSEVKKKRRK